MHRRVCTTGFHVILKKILKKNLTCPMKFFEDRWFRTYLLNKKDAKMVQQGMSKMVQPESDSNRQ